MCGVCICVCVHVCMVCVFGGSCALECAHVWVHAHLCTFVQLCVCVCVWRCVCTKVCAHLYLCVCLEVCVYLGVCMCVVCVSHICCEFVRVCFRGGKSMDIGRKATNKITDYKTHSQTLHDFPASSSSCLHLLGQKPVFSSGRTMMLLLTGSIYKHVRSELHLPLRMGQHFPFLPD